WRRVMSISSRCARGLGCSVVCATERVIAHGICNIHVFARHVLLGFPRGTDLDDPAGVLQGTGKGMRHIIVKKLSIWIGRRYGRTLARPGSTRPHTASSN